MFIYDLTHLHSHYLCLKLLTIYSKKKIDKFMFIFLLQTGLQKNTYLPLDNIGSNRFINNPCTNLFGGFETNPKTSHHY